MGPSGYLAAFLNVRDILISHYCAVLLSIVREHFMRNDKRNSSNVGMYAFRKLLSVL